MGPDIVQFKQDQRELWPLLGPFLVQREVVKALEGPVYADETTTWFIAVEDGRALGFLALRETPTSYWRDYVYVVPDRRGQGLHGQMAAAADAYLAARPPKPLRLVCRQWRWRHYDWRGWTIEKQRGDWLTIVRR